MRKRHAFKTTAVCTKIHAGSGVCEICGAEDFVGLCKFAYSFMMNGEKIGWRVTANTSPLMCFKCAKIYDGLFDVCEVTTVRRA